MSNRRRFPWPGYRCLLVTTDDTSPEKLRLMRALGATVEVRPHRIVQTESSTPN